MMAMLRLTIQIQYERGYVKAPSKRGPEAKRAGNSHPSFVFDGVLISVAINFKQASAFSAVLAPALHD